MPDPVESVNQLGLLFPEASCPGQHCGVFGGSASWLARSEITLSASTRMCGWKARYRTFAQPPPAMCTSL